MAHTIYSVRYVLRTPRPGVPYEEQEYTSLDAAWEAFRLFAEPASAELYSEIELSEYTWATETENRLASMSF